MHATFPAHIIIFDLTTLIRTDDEVPQYTIFSMKFTSLTLSLKCSHHLALKLLPICVIALGKQTKFHAIKTRKIIVLYILIITFIDKRL
jgi:hypothetical protein